MAKLVSGFLLAGLVLFTLSYGRSKKPLYKYQSLVILAALLVQLATILAGVLSRDDAGTDVPADGGVAHLWALPSLMMGLLIPAALRVLRAYDRRTSPADSTGNTVPRRLAEWSVRFSGRPYGQVIMHGVFVLLPILGVIFQEMWIPSHILLMVSFFLCIAAYLHLPASRGWAFRGIPLGFAIAAAALAMNLVFPVAGVFLVGAGVLLVVLSFLVLQENHFLEAEAQAEAATQELRFIENHDTLTGLYNRGAFFDRLKQESLLPERRFTPLAVLYLDLDHFRDINDNLGNEAGNYLLLAVAERLTMLRLDTEMVFRTGEDEFAVLAPCPSSHIDAALVAEEVVASFNKPFRVLGNEVFLSASIGITFLQTDKDGVCPEPGEISRQVDQALEHAKLDRNTYRFFTPGIGERGLSKLQYVNFLRQAIDRHELSLHFQPQVDHRGTVVAAEALLRWNNPVLGSVPPSEFVALAEEAGLIIPIGEWVIEQACAELAHWRSIGVDIPMAINISARQLKDLRLERVLLARLKKYGLRPDCLHLEITESSLLEDSEHYLETLNNLTRIGFKLSIDDFGTGYANLSYLKRLPVSTVKIDRSFVIDLPNNQQDLAVVQAICSMAKGLGLSIIAEGVDSHDQKDLLHAAECMVIQGFLYSRPLPSHDFIAYVQSIA